MSTAGRHARRSVRAMLLGSALAALLTITSAGAASGAYQSGVSEAAGTAAAEVASLNHKDVWMKDHDSDTGIAPHTIEPIYWSPDIKVCNGPLECATSQNPIVGTTNWVFVNLRYPGPGGGSTPTTGTLHLYRTSPGGGSAWPGGWTLIGTATTSVPVGGTTVRITWNGVPGPGHFCLLARWVSDDDPMAPEGPVTTTNTRNSNNIAWRNVDSVFLQPDGDRDVRPFNIGNALATTTQNDILFTQHGGGAFREVGGQVVVDLGQELFDRWRRGGAAGTNVRHVGGTELEILDPARASISNLTLGPREQFSFRIFFSARALSTNREPFLLNVAQFGPDGTNNRRTDLGGVLYQVTVGRVTTPTR